MLLAGLGCFLGLGYIHCRSAASLLFQDPLELPPALKSLQNPYWDVCLALFDLDSKLGFDASLVQLIF